MFHAEKPTITISPSIIAPPSVNSKGRFICDASLLAFRASGGITKIMISSTKTIEAPAAVSAIDAFPVWSLTHVERREADPAEHDDDAHHRIAKIANTEDLGYRSEIHNGAICAENGIAGRGHASS